MRADRQRHNRHQGHQWQYGTEPGLHLRGKRVSTHPVHE